MRAGRGRPGETFDVVFYAPWASNLVGGSDAAGAAGGAETQLSLLAVALAERGLRVGMIVIGPPDELPASTRGVRILRQPQRRRARGLLARAALARGALGAMAGARTRVLVQRNAGSTTAVAALAARLRRARFVYSSASVVDFDLGRLEPLMNVRLFEWGVRRAAEVVVQTDEQAALCRRRFGRDSVVIRSIAEHAERRDAVPEAFLWIGSLAVNKRLDVYLELARAVSEARFQVVAVPGADERSQALLERARAKVPNLEVLEPRPRAELAPLIERAVAIVNTSEYEGMPNTFLEGWARGVPALAFSHDPDGVVVRHGLGAFAAGSAQRLAELARQQWATRYDQDDIAERCTAYVDRHHATEAVVAGWLDVIAPRP